MVAELHEVCKLFEAELELMKGIVGCQAFGMLLGFIEFKNIQVKVYTNFTWMFCYVSLFFISYLSNVLSTLHSYGTRSRRFFEDF